MPVHRREPQDDPEQHEEQPVVEKAPRDRPVSQASGVESRDEHQPRGDEKHDDESGELADAGHGSEEVEADLEQALHLRIHRAARFESRELLQVAEFLIDRRRRTGGRNLCATLLDRGAAVRLAAFRRRS